MSQWYYADAQRQRHGPVDADVLRAKFNASELGLDTLVWREGMAQWQPLSTMTGELQLLEPVLGASLPKNDTDGAAAGDATTDAQAYSPYTAPTSITRVTRNENVVYAGFLRRFAAACIDGLVTGVISYALIIPLVLAMGGSLRSLEPNSSANVGAVLGFEGIIYFISFSVPCLYFGWMYASSNMASLGKMATGIKVVRTNGQRIGFWRGFLRYLAFLGLGVVSCYIAFIVSAFMSGLTERKQAIHDMMCDTLVVDKWAFTDHPEWQQRGVGTATVVILSIWGVFLLIAVIAIVAAIAIGAANSH